MFRRVHFDPKIFGEARCVLRRETIRGELPESKEVGEYSSVIAQVVTVFLIQLCDQGTYVVNTFLRLDHSARHLTQSESVKARSCAEISGAPERKGSSRAFVRVI